MKFLRAACASLLPFISLSAIAAGALDASFGTAGRAVHDFTTAANQGEYGSALAIQSDGKLLVASETNVAPARVIVSRHLTSGALDTTFGSGGRVTLDFGACAQCPVTSPSLALAGDGTILVGATEAISTVSSLTVTNIVVTRLSTAGAVSTGFGVNGVARVNPEGSSRLHDLSLQGDGRVLLAGATGTAGLMHWLVLRLTAAGALDSSFTDRAASSPDISAPSVAQRIRMQSDGHIVVVGRTPGGLRGFRYWMQDASLMTFATTMHGDFADLAIDSQDRVWLLSAGTAGSEVVRLGPAFEGGTGFLGDSLPQGVAFASIVPLASGEAFLAGGRGLVAAQGAGFSTGASILKLDAAGRIDTAFGDAGSLAIDRFLLNRIARQSNGRLVAVGARDATPAEGNTRLALVRVDPAASAFATSEWVSFPVQSIGTRSAAQVLTVANPGTTTSTVKVTAPANFEVQGCPATLAAGAKCTVTVTHRPTATAAAFTQMDFAPTALTISDDRGRSASVQLYSGVEKSLVQHYYRSILRRDADGGGWDYWSSEARRMRSEVDSLSGVADTSTTEAWYAMAMSFFSSAEYAGRASADDAYVTDLYRTFFDRAPDAEGMAFWRGQLSQGLPREAILTSFMFSPEFATFNATYFGGAASRPEVDLVMDMYRGLLGRLPDTQGLAYWVQRMRTAQCKDAAAVRAEADLISAQFAGSTEYANRGRSNAQNVADLYNAFLRRAGDAAGFGYWKSGMDAGTISRDAARLAFIASPEFAARVQLVISAGCR